MEQSETKTLSAPTGGYTEYGTYAGQYIYQTKKGSDTITIHVAKSAKKNFLFFDKYEVTSITDTSATIKTVKLFTMPGVTVKVDGIAAKVPENTSGNTYYTRMFEGTHKITFHGADGVSFPASSKAVRRNRTDRRYDGSAHCHEHIDLSVR